MNRVLYAKVTSQKDVVYIGIVTEMSGTKEIKLDKVLCLGQLVGNEMKDFQLDQLFGDVAFSLNQVKNIEYGVQPTEKYLELLARDATKEETQEDTDDPDVSEVPSPPPEERSAPVKVPPAFKHDGEFYDSFVSVNRPRFNRNYKDDIETFGTRLEPSMRKKVRPFKK